jgi:hypothetical protein
MRSARSRSKQPGDLAVLGNDRARTGAAIRRTLRADDRQQNAATVLRDERPAGVDDPLDLVHATGTCIRLARNLGGRFARAAKA